MKRRDILVAAGATVVAGVAFPKVTAGASVPCPPPELGLAGGEASTTTACAPTGGALPNHIQNAVAGQWTPIGANTLAAVRLPAASLPAGFSGNLQAIMKDWSGACYNPAVHKLYVHGGGHNGYDGNEFYAFNVQTNLWSRLDDPTLLAEEDYPTGQFPDGSPIPIHTYDALEVDTNTGKVYRLLGGGSNASQVYEFNPAVASTGTVATKSWWAKRAANALPGSTSGASAWAVDEGVFYVCVHDGGCWFRLGRYNPTTNSWGSLIDPGINYCNDISMAYSQSRRICVVLMGSQVAVLNCNTNTMAVQATTGAAFSGKAIRYDTVRDRFIVYNDQVADRRQFWSINPSTWVVTLTSPSGPTIGTGASGGEYFGIFGRFRYCSDYDVYLAVNEVGGSVYIYKPIGWSGP